MRTMLTILSLMLTFTVFAQDDIYKFQSSQLELKKKGEPINTTTAEPTTITVNLAENTLTIETTSPDVTDLMKGQMVRKIESRRGDIGPQYSLSIETNTFVHFYLNGQNMIIFTRNDVHPLEWGMMFKEVEQVD